MTFWYKKIAKMFSISIFLLHVLAVWRRETGDSRVVTSIPERKFPEFCSVAEFVLALPSMYVRMTRTPTYMAEVTKWSIDIPFLLSNWTYPSKTLNNNLKIGVIHAWLDKDVIFDFGWHWTRWSLNFPVPAEVENGMFVASGTNGADFEIAGVLYN